MALSSNAEDSDGATSEEFSDISDDSDLFHLTVEPEKTWRTEQDADEANIVEIAMMLRLNPFVPADPTDPVAERDWEDVQSGVALPRAHCAFRGCRYVDDVIGDTTRNWENSLRLWCWICPQRSRWREFGGELQAPSTLLI